MNSQPDNLSHSSESEDASRYVIFRLGAEIYGARLLDVREVVEMLPTKVVPNTIPSFRGVCNLRGQIVGVIDLRLRFGIQASDGDRPVLLVFDTDTGAIAAAVDQVSSVSQIPQSDIDWSPNIVSNVPSKFIAGIAKVDKQMITLVDLKSILSTEELTFLDKTKIVKAEGAAA